MEVEVSKVIDRPPSIVWDFCVVHHMENHPRWDPSVELEPTSSDPIGVGTIISRRTNRFGNITEGTMEIIDFQPLRAMRAKIQDGSMTIYGKLLVEGLGDQQTKLVMGGEFPDLDDSMKEKIRPLMERSASNIKLLIESET
ncbi:MAG TPA: SRPBCC family protein [Acidimicrobiia bacterium]|nr:SRPBCC family protein [Acidimicrobiia bacterium]